MTSRDLLNAAMQLDQSFLDEADQRAAAAIPAGRKRIQLISAISAAAACLTAVVGLRIYSLHHQNGLTEQSSAPDSIVAEVIPETETTTTVTETTAADAETKRAATTLVSASNTSKSKQTESTTATAAVSGTAKTTASKGNAGTTKGSTAAKSDTVSSTTTTTSRNRGKTTVVPYFLHITWEEAEELANYHEVKVTKKLVDHFNEDDADNSGQVVAQSIEVDTEVEKGTVIELTVLEGEPDLIPVMLWFQIFPSYTGKYHIDLYEDGKLVAAGPQFQPEYTTRDNDFVCTPLEFAGEGASTYEAMLVNEETGEKAKIGRYYVDFDTMKFSVLEEQPIQAFRQLGGIAPDDTYDYEFMSEHTKAYFYTHYSDYRHGLEALTRTDEVQFKIPSNYYFPEDASSIFKIVAYADGIACADSGWVDASVPDTVITLTLESFNYRPGFTHYVFVLYPKVPDKAECNGWNIGVGHVDSFGYTENYSNFLQALNYLGGWERYVEPGESADSDE